MKINCSSLMLSVTFLILFTNNVLSDQSSDAICWDVPNPTNLSHQVQRSCRMIKSWKRAPVNDSDMFIISFNCSVENEKPELCQKARNAFNTAGQIISSSIKFNTPLVVNASLSDFCNTSGQCNSGPGHTVLGGAGPSSFVYMQERVYPQAILKQIRGVHPEYSKYDITAMFNSKGNYWFEGDGPINRDQSDFLFVILHELIHGLGFVSGWDVHDDLLGIPNLLTPYPIFLQNGTGGIIFAGFTELIFDKFMVLLPEGTRVSDLVAELNKFSGIGTSYSSLADFLNDFKSTFPSSPQYNISQNMMIRATTPKSLGLLSSNKTDVKDAFILETSIVPYLSKSSISHCDYKTYTDSDFLMRYLQDPGVSLKQSIRLGKNYAGGPIGPKLTETLSLLGYQTQDLPNPFKPNPDEIRMSNTASSLKTIQFSLFSFLLLFLTCKYI